ncbi:MAG: IclR family transcriptional regulator [Paenibacillaceae bacterium]|nr:IclR family transcriptional regulator [Paenibacillaceae bacterium]
MSSAPGLESGLKILELVIKSNGADGISFSQMKQELDLNAASLTRYLRVLLESQFLGKADNQLYVPGAKLLRLSNSVKEFGEIGAISAVILEQISRSTGFTALWIDYWHGRLRCRDKHIAPEGVVMQQVGAVRTDYILHPWGYLWLAEQPDQDRKFLIEHAALGNFGGDMPTEEKMEQFMADAARQGWVDDRGSIYRGNRRIAAGIRFEGRLVCAIAVGMPDARWDEAVVQHVVQVLKEKAAQVEAHLSQKNPM